MSKWDSHFRASKRSREIRKQFELSVELVHKIIAHPRTYRISYEDMPEPFDYVDKLYPGVGVKNAEVYHASKPYLDEIGYKGCGGFYNVNTRIICITDWIGVPNSDLDVMGQFTLDEVLCHELIHFAAHSVNASTKFVEEEIAYSKSIEYLRKKGRSDDFIIRKNMMPYLVSVVDRPKVYREFLLRRYDETLLAKCSKEALNGLLRSDIDSLQRAIIAEAYKVGKQIIQLYATPLKEKTFISSVRELDIDSEL